MSNQGHGLLSHFYIGFVCFVLIKDVNGYSNIRIFVFVPNIRIRFLNSNIRIFFLSLRFLVIFSYFFVFFFLQSFQTQNYRLVLKGG